MFTHVCVGADDVHLSKKFYDAALGPLGVEAGTVYYDKACVYVTDSGKFIVTAPADGGAASSGNGVTVGFPAASPAAVDAFHSAGIANGGTDEGAPGPRESAPGAYGAYLRDPFGNKVCAFHGL